MSFLAIDAVAAFRSLDLAHPPGWPPERPQSLAPRGSAQGHTARSLPRLTAGHQADPASRQPLGSCAGPPRHSGNLPAGFRIGRRPCRLNAAARRAVSLDQSPAWIAPPFLLGHLPSRLDFAAGLLRVHLNAVCHAGYGRADCKHAPAPVVVLVETWAGLGKVVKLLAPTCASRLTRKRPGADPRGGGGPNGSRRPRVDGVMHHETTPLLTYRTVVPRPSFWPALVGFTGSATVLIGVMLLLSSVAQ